jgi:hypothetical protein
MKLVIKKSDMDGYPHAPQDWNEIKAIWKYLIEHKWRHLRTVSYLHVRNHVIYKGRTPPAPGGLEMRFRLGVIEYLCKKLKLPHINVLVVNRQTKRPGSWVYDATQEAHWRKSALEVFGFDWDDVEFE